MGFCLYFYCRSTHTSDPTLSPMSSATSSASCLLCQFMPSILGSACSSSATTSTMSTLILFETAMKVSPSALKFPMVARKEKKLTKLVFHTSHCLNVSRLYYLRCYISRWSNFRRILFCKLVNVSQRKNTYNVLSGWITF